MEKFEKLLQTWLRSLGDFCHDMANLFDHPVDIYSGIDDSTPNPVIPAAQLRANLQPLAISDFPDIVIDEPEVIRPSIVEVLEPSPNLRHHPV